MPGVRVRTMADNDDQEWKLDAACIGLTDLFFSEDRTDVEQARRICVGCPVRQECRVAGRPEQWGVWAGVLHLARHSRQSGQRGHPAGRGELYVTRRETA